MEQTRAPLVERARRNGTALMAWQVGSVDDAKAAEDAGCDFVVVQGVEAGGHVYGTVQRDRLLAGAIEAVSIPVVAAGGIGTASDLAGVIAAGAAAARVGTRFVATVESSAHPDYVAALVAAASEDDTVLTTAFALGWPDAPHRVLRRCVDNATAHDGDVVGYVVQDGERHAVPRFAASPPTKQTEGDISAMALYAGTGVTSVTRMQSAGEVVAELVSDLT
ncbi:MAG: NAD(P)H-dependent flavin oxidoreductase [Actinomycetes bacterium]